MNAFRFNVRGLWAIALVGSVVWVGIGIGRGDWIEALCALALTVGIVVAHRDGGSR